MNFKSIQTASLQKILLKTNPLMDEVFDIPKFDNYEFATDELLFELQVSTPDTVKQIADSISDVLNHAYGSEIFPNECILCAREIMRYLESLK